MEDKKIPLEIERKFLVRFPDIGVLDKLCFSRSEIIQTYLVNTNEDSSSRIRLRNTDGLIEYTKTEKKRVSDMTRIEHEDDINRDEYEKLLLTADPDLRTIEKTRWCISYKSLVLEVDVFPFWKDRAFLEIELESEDRWRRQRTKIECDD